MRGGSFCLSDLVELRGLEPLTPCMPCRCATSCATAPNRCPHADQTARSNLTSLMEIRARRQSAGIGATHKKIRRNLSIPADHPVELRGLEPLTPCMPCRCATSCATAPDLRCSVVSPEQLKYLRPAFPVIPNPA